MENQGLVNSEGIKEQFFSLDDAAQQLGISRKGLDTYLNNHPELKEKYLTKAHLGGRRRYVLDVRALPFISITRGGNSKNLQVEGISKMKKELAEKVIEQKVNESENTLLKEMFYKQSEMIDTLVGILKANGLIKTMQLQLPTTEEKPPELDFRQKITQRVNAYAKENGVEIKDVRGRLYYEFSIRHGVNIRTRADNAGISQIDVLAEMNKLKEAWILACDIFKLKGE